MTDTPTPSPSTGAHVGLRVTHRRYVDHGHAHYAGGLVDGAFGLGLFGDVATELCIRSDGDEGLFASYSDVQFLAPVRAGDVVEATAEVVAVGTRSRTLAFTLSVLTRGAADPGTPGTAASAAAVLESPLVATTAIGTVVVPSRP
ncbi:MAG: hotdog fold domain-containing protein [Nocardioides sp.]|nr:hotdog fold domain-containing protein [Nocardioides sp.]